MARRDLISIDRNPIERISLKSKKKKERKEGKEKKRLRKKLNDTGLS